MSEALLNIRDLEVIYKTGKEIVHAVNGISFSVRKGETLGIVGETGAGKTTVSLAIMRLLSERTAFVPRGEVIFEGHDLLQMSQSEIRKIRGEKISMIFQDPMTALNPTMPIGKQISEALQLHNINSRRAI